MRRFVVRYINEAEDTDISLEFFAYTGETAIALNTLNTFFYSRGEYTCLVKGKIIITEIPFTMEDYNIEYQRVSVTVS